MSVTYLKMELEISTPLKDFSLVILKHDKLKLYYTQPSPLKKSYKYAFAKCINYRKNIIIVPILKKTIYYFCH